VVEGVGGPRERVWRGQVQLLAVVGVARCGLVVQLLIAGAG